MRTANTRREGRIGLNTRFNLDSTPSASYRAAEAARFLLLKNRILGELLSRTPDSKQFLPLRRAANEAEALAWLTPFPELVFPVLLEEMARVALRQTARQAQIRETGRGWFATAE